MGEVVKNRTVKLAKKSKVVRDNLVSQADFYRSMMELASKQTNGLLKNGIASSEEAYAWLNIYKESSQLYNDLRFIVAKKDEE